MHFSYCPLNRMATMSGDENSICVQVLVRRVLEMRVMALVEDLVLVQHVVGYIVL